MKNSLSFTKFRVWEVVVPARQDLIACSSEGGAAYSGAVTWPDLPVHLIEGETDAGFVAVGESGRGEPREAVERTLRELLGRDLTSFAPETVWAASHAANGLPSPYPTPSWHHGAGRSYVVMESLWLDAMGKASGLPAHRLLGGAYRNRVPVDFWANRPDATGLAKLVNEAAALGLHGIKLKGDSSGSTALAVTEIATDTPAGFHFTIDPMCSWRTLRESLKFFQSLESLECEVRIEDPFPHGAISEWHKAAAAFPQIPFIWHARDEATLRAALKEGTGDAFNLSGPGTWDFLRAAAAVRFHGKDCWHGSAIELGVLQHWRLHAAACAPNCIMASDLQSEWVREHTLVTPRMQYASGCALLPETPGLGISLDHDALPAFTRSHWEI